MALKVQRFCKVSRSGAEEYALHASGHYETSAHATTACKDNLFGRNVVAGIFGIFQCRDRPVFCLDGIASRLRVGTLG